MSDIERPSGQVIVYADAEGRLKLDVRLDGDTVWLTQQGMAELFQTSQQNISHDVRQVYEEGELAAEATHKDYLSVRQEGERSVRRAVTHYNLDMIISVGYRVKSQVATRFRIWATEKITDIYATSVDYDPTLDVSITFFKTVQNKMHWAITGQTAAEIILERSDAGQPNMGLTTWRGATLRKRDVGIAKNYLIEDELRELNNLVEQYLVFAEGQAMRRIPMTMVDWIAKLDGFLSLNDRDILRGAGRVSHDVALAKAETEYTKFHAVRIAESDRQESDFDRAVRELPPRPAGTDSPQDDAT